MGNQHSGESKLNHVSDAADGPMRLQTDDTLSMSADLTNEATLVDDAAFEGSDTAVLADADLDQLIHDNQVDASDVMAPHLIRVKPGTSADATDSYIRGKEHLQQRNWTVAAELFQHAISRDPSRNGYHAGRALACLAYAHYKLGEGEESIRLYLEAADVDRNISGTRSGLAAAFMLAGRYEEAIEALKDAIRHDPKRLTLHFNLGNLLARLNRFDESEASYRSGLQCDAAHGPLLTNLGAVLAQQKKHADAIAALLIACEQPEPSWRSRFNLGLVLARLHRWTDSLEVLRGLCADYPECPRTRILTARVMRCGGRHLEAIEVLDEFVDWGDWRATSQELMGLIHESLGNPVQAVVFWKEALHSDPGFARPLGHLAMQALREGELAEATTAIKKAIRIRDDSATLWMIQGQIDLAKGAFDSAVDSLEKSVAIDESFHDARYWLGRAHLENQNLVGAAHQYERLEAAQSPLAERLKRRLV